eukprot:730508-Pyramimonas_sp.AAC.1
MTKNDRAAALRLSAVASRISPMRVTFQLTAKTATALRRHCDCDRDCDWLRLYLGGELGLRPHRP